MEPQDWIVLAQDGLQDDLQHYYDCLSKAYTKFIIAREIGTKKEGLHFHILLWTDVSKKTTRKRLKEMLQLKLFRTSGEKENKPIENLLHMVAYTVKDKNYLEKNIDPLLLEDAIAYSFPKMDNAFQKTMKEYTKEIMADYMEDNINEGEVITKYLDYNLDTVDSIFQEKNLDNFLTHLYLKRDLQARYIFSQEKLKKWQQLQKKYSLQL